MISEATDAMKLARLVCVGIALLACALPPAQCLADRPDAVPVHPHRSLSDSRFAWPTWQQVARVVTLRDQSTRTVAVGTMMLGMSGGAVGAYMLLRKRSLIGDVVSHASLPGVAGAFIFLELVRPGSGRSLPGLLTGALVAGVLGVLCVVGIRKAPRVKEDAALAIVLSIFFGLGIALLTIVQNLPTGSAAGLQHFIYGKTASLTGGDAWLIGAASLCVVALCALLAKEFALLCFDEDYAAAQGWPVTALDLLLMALAVAVTVIGLQSVGLLLVVATLIIPPAAARFWTDRTGRMVVVSVGIGGLSAALGVLASALFPRLPAGAVIVLMGTAAFLVSLLVGTRRGVLRRWWLRRSVARRIGRHDLLRAFYEILEPSLPPDRAADPTATAHRPVSWNRLLAMRTWAPRRLNRLLAEARRAELVCGNVVEGYRLTESGAREAARAARNHRLWEIFLIRYADIAPSHVDRNADQIEHVLEPELIAELDQLLARRFPAKTVPPSPHEIERPIASAGRL